MILSLAGLALLAAIPDILPIGHKSVRHELVLEWDEGQHAGVRFVASPVRGFHGHVVIESGKPFRFSSKYGTRVYVIPASVALPDARERIARDAQYEVLAIPRGEVRSIAVTHALARVRTTLRVARDADGKRQLVVSDEARFDAAGRALGSGSHVVLWVVSGLGLVCLVVLYRRRRRDVPAHAT